MPLMGRKAPAARSKTKPKRGPLRPVTVLLPANAKPTVKTAVNVRPTKSVVILSTFSG